MTINDQCPANVTNGDQHSPWSSLGVALVECHTVPLGALGALGAGHPPAFKIYLQTARSLEFKDWDADAWQVESSCPCHVRVMSMSCPCGVENSCQVSQVLVILHEMLIKFIQILCSSQIYGMLN